MLTGHISIGKGLLYMMFQIFGSILGSLVLAGLITPTAVIGNAALPSGCFGKSGVDGGQLFGWELIMTFVLVPHSNITLPHTLGEYFPSKSIFICTHPICGGLQRNGAIQSTCFGKSDFHYGQLLG